MENRFHCGWRRSGPLGYLSRRHVRIERRELHDDCLLRRLGGLREQIEEPEFFRLAQIDRSGIVEDESHDITSMDPPFITALLRSARGAASACDQPSSDDPTPHDAESHAE